MGLLEDIQQLQAQGRSDQEIIGMLAQRGMNPQEISNIMSQVQIKEAVTGDAPDQNYPPQQYAPAPQAPQPGQDYQAYGPQDPAYGTYQQQQGYDPAAQQTYDTGGYPPAISTDTMSEIAEQTVIEKLAPLKKQLEEVIDLKTTVDAKLAYLDERLLRIERTIDRLQLSIMQKVGQYVGDVQDIKKEMQETNKTFKAIAEKRTHHEHKS